MSLCSWQTLACETAGCGFSGEGLLPGTGHDFSYCIIQFDRAGYPFTPPAVNPSSRYRSIARKSNTIGTVMMVEAAITT